MEEIKSVRIVNARAPTSNCPRAESPPGAEASGVDKPP